MNGNNVQSFTADVALTAHLLVKKTATGVDLCGATDKVIGSVHHDVKITQACDVLLFNGFPTHFMVVGNATAIAVGDEVEQLASGKIGKFVTGQKVGVALEAATSADSIIRVMAYPAAASGGDTIVVPQAAIADIATADATDLTTSEALANATKAKFNTLLAELRTAGILTP